MSDEQFNEGLQKYRDIAQKIDNQADVVLEEANKSYLEDVEKNSLMTSKS